jgi:hypothetical protein
MCPFSLAYSLLPHGILSYQALNRTDAILQENLDFEDSSGRTPLYAAVTEKRSVCTNLFCPSRSFRFPYLTFDLI